MSSEGSSRIIVRQLGNLRQQAGDRGATAEDAAINSVSEGKGARERSQREEEAGERKETVRLHQKNREGAN